MLTSFFSKSKPVNTIVVLAYMTLGFIIANVSSYEDGFEGLKTLKLIGVGLLYIFTMFVLNFISQKNELTRRTSYRILLFACFTMAFPEALRRPEIIVSGVFIMLATRRILSLRSGRHMERKLFDAGLWIGLAVLVFFWSHFFIIVLVGSLFYYGKSSWRYWIIPYLAFFAIAILTYCYMLFIDDNSIILRLVDDASFDFKKYSSLKVLVPVSFVISLLLWTIWTFIKELGAGSVALRSTFFLILFFTLASLGIVLFASQKDGAEWYFFSIPLAIIATSFFENTSSKWISEVLLWIIILLPFSYYFL